MANNPKERQQWILDTLKINPTLSYSECWGEYKVKWGKGQSTFDKDWNISSNTFKEYQIKLNNEKDKESIAKEIEVLKNGIKTKHERLMILQNEIDECIYQLDLGTSKFRRFDPELEDYIIDEKPLSIFEKVALRRAIKELQSEISKIQGDYEIDNKQKQPGVLIDYSKLTDEAVKSLTDASK